MNEFTERPQGGLDNSNELILSIENLNIFSRNNDEVSSNQILKDVVLSCYKKKTLGIVGESGSGKSLTALSIPGLLPIEQLTVKGTIMYFGSLSTDTKSSKNSHFQSDSVDLLKLKEKELQAIRGAEISMIFQEPMTSLNPLHRLGHQVSEALIVHRICSPEEAKNRTLHLFDEVQLPRPKELYKAYPHEISGGQKQRVMIAMALACNPKLLIADEPTTALDVTVQKTILSLLNSLKNERNLSMIFITHDLGAACEVVDDVAVMRHGSVVESGTKEQVFGDPKHDYTRNLIKCRPPLHKILYRLPTIDLLQRIQIGNPELTDDYNISNVPNNSDDESSVESIKEDFDNHIFREITSDEFNSRIARLKNEETLVRVKDLNCRYILKRNFFGSPVKYLDAVKNVSFEIKKGEILGLVGESGSGKSTIGRCILRIQSNFSGEIYFEDKNLSKQTQSELRPIRKDFQMVFQDPYSSLNPKFKILDTLTEPMRAHGIGTYAEQKDRAMELIHQVGLQPEHLHRYPREFSGGQRQRICIARALATSPKFIVCDESVSALDVSVQAQILNLLKDLKEQYKLTLLFITHDLSVVRFICDRVITLMNGCIVEENNTQDLYLRPQHPYTKKLLESVPRFEFD